MALWWLTLTLWWSLADGFKLRQDVMRGRRNWRRAMEVADQPRVASLAGGNWVKFICGASNQDLPLVRNLSLLYTLAGVDCIDVSADPAVVHAADDGMKRACEMNLFSEEMSEKRVQRPLLMVSVNDGQDLHFRKASFDPLKCPSDCPRPCEKVCPAWAIPSISLNDGKPQDGVISDRCYGCGRCIPTCPLGLIDEVAFVADRAVISRLFESNLVDAIEVHTTRGQESSFANLWTDIGNKVLPQAKVIAVSFPDMDEDTLPYLSRLQQIMNSHNSWQSFRGVQIWQTDGRPMSGDIGRGTAHAATNFAMSFLKQAADYRPLGSASSLAQQIDVTTGRQYVQLAGGTNDYSASLARSQGLSGSLGFGGFAFGGYARREIGNILRELEDRLPGSRIEDHKQELQQCLDFAQRLVRTVKQ